MNVTDFLDQFQTIKIPILGVRLPEFEIDAKYKTELGLEGTASNAEFLRALCKRGFNTLALTKGSPEYKEYGERVKHELDIMQELGFVDYMLMVWDVINFCNENNIPTGLGRGSAAGSLVLYLIGVTKIDPIKYGLYFERFISKIRAKKTVIEGITYLDGSLMCDVDMDICYYNRPKVLAYLDQKYKGKTSKILTFNTLSAKLLIKEIGKIVGGKTDEEMTRVTSMIPKQHGVVQDLDETYYGVENKPEDQAKAGKWKITPVQEFVEWCDANPLVFDIAKKLKDLNKNKGVHPSGILISYDKLADSCPTELSSDKDIVSSYDMNWVSLFTVKLDALGLRGVSVVDDVCKMLGIDMMKIDLNDPSIYRALQDLKYPHGLFQIEADLAFRFTQKVKPRNLNELSAVMALARPGAMQFIDQFSTFTTTGVVQDIHPFFADILAETGGVCLYQEQMMRMAHKVGFTLDEAEILRRIVGKKKVEEVKAWQAKIKAKIAENGLEPVISDILWKILEDSASYSFNKSHSVAYAALSALTIYLKFNYPTEFYLSLLKMTKHEPDPISEIAKIHKEMQHFGIGLLPPSLATSKMDFAIEGKDIRFGLSSIKGISEKTIEKLNNFKREHANKFELFEAAKEAGLSIGIVSALIQAGTLDKFGKTRTLLVYEAQLWNKLKPKEKKLAKDLGPKFDFALAKIVKAMNKELKDEKSKPLIKDSRMETLKNGTKTYKAIYEQNSVSESFANWWYEKRLLGYVTCTNLLDIFRAHKPTLVTIHDALQLPEGRYVDFVGFLDDDATLGTSRTARKSKYAKYSMSDEGGTIKVMIFNDSLEECKVLNGGRLPKANDIVIVTGVRKGEDTIFANLIATQQNKIYTKLSDLKDTEVLD
jgi:DNA polymerase III subunit alpha